MSSHANFGSARHTCDAVRPPEAVATNDSTKCPDDAAWTIARAAAKSTAGDTANHADPLQAPRLASQSATGAVNAIAVTFVNAASTSNTEATIRCGGRTPCAAPQATVPPASA